MKDKKKSLARKDVPRKLTKYLFFALLPSVLVIWGVPYLMGIGPGWLYGGEDIFIVKEDGKYFFINTENSLVKKDKFDYIDVQSDGFFRICKEGKWGYLDETLTIHIDPQYKECGNFHDGLAPVNKGEYWSYINHANEVVINERFEWAGDFFDGKAVVQNGENFNIIDKTGKILDGPFYACDRLYENAFIVQKSAQSTQIVLGEELEEIELNEEELEVPVSLYNGRMIISYIEDKKKQAKLIDLNSSEILIDHVNSISVTYDGNYFCLNGKEWELRDKTMNTVCEQSFENVIANSVKLYPVSFHNKWGAVNSDGKIVINPKYKSMGPFSSGFASVQAKNGFWGVIDEAGKEIIPCNYDFAQYALCKEYSI